MNIAVQHELEKLDAIRSRMNVSYDEARKALDEAGGDLVQALVNLEGEKGDLLSVGINLLDDVQKLIESGAPRKLRIKFDGKLVAEYPVALTAAAAVVVGLAALIISKATVEIEHEKAQVEEQAS